MLIGAHVSPAGGVAKAVERGVERGCHAIQIFNQNPRAWKPREYAPDDIEAFHAAMDGSDVDVLLIHDLDAGYHGDDGLYNQPFALRGEPLYLARIWMVSSRNAL